MISGSRKHRQYLADLQRQAMADADLVRALCALTEGDREWLQEAGWSEPDHAAFVRLNRLDVDALPVAI